MQQIVIPKYGDVNVFEFAEKPDPTPGQGELAIRVKASGINFADIMARKGLYPDAPKLPMVVGYEVAGLVESVGDGVNRDIIGKEVIALTRFNGYADRVIVTEGQIFNKPASLSFEEAAAIPVNYLTAYQLLVVQGGLKAGEAILIHNVGGGVGLAALDIAQKIGAVTYGTASGHKETFLKERGLQHFINYREQDWLKQLNSFINDQGVELVIDPIGGANCKKSYRALRSTGRLGIFGISAATQGGLFNKLNGLLSVMQMPWFHPIGLMNGNKSVFGVNLGHMWHEVNKVETWMAEILKGVEAGWVRPHVDKVFYMEEVAAAHRHIEERKNIGKVLLRPKS